MLYCQQIGATFEHVGGKAMPESVRTDGFGDTISLGEVFYDEKDHLSGEPCATAVEENGVGELPPLLRGDALEPFRERGVVALPAG